MFEICNECPLKVLIFKKVRNEVRTILSIEVHNYKPLQWWQPPLFLSQLDILMCINISLNHIRPWLEFFKMQLEVEVSPHTKI